MPTTNFNLPLYGTGDTAALDTLLNGQSNAIDSALAANLYRLGGTDAARTALAAPKRKEGLGWYSTDTDREWRYDGSNWQPVDNGTYLIFPSSVGNASVSTDGTIVPSGAGTDLTVNGVFSTRFRKYRIEYNFKTATAVQLAVRLVSAGVVFSSTNYNFTTLETNGSTVTGANFTATSAWPLNNVSTLNQWGWFYVINPMHTGTDQVKLYEAMASGTSTGNSLAMRNGICTGQESNTYDGFRITENAGSSNLAATGWLKVYGLA